MSASPSPVPLETLLTHRAWVRRLARSLVIDGPSADDVEQQTWLAALRHPPQHQSTARAWLGRVVRNLALDSGRARRRRDAHELMAARPEAVRSTADVVAEAQAHTHLVTAVNSLAEPYRTTVLLRWFEDMPPTTIAGRMGVPVETVRTRLRRAHQKLRDELGSQAGDGAGWVAALLPLAGVRLESVGSYATVTAAPAAALGGAVMGTKTAIAVGLGVALAGAFVGGTMAGSSGEHSSGENEVAALRARLEALETKVDATARRSPSGGERRSSGVDDRVSAHESRIAEVEAALGLVRADMAKIDGKETGTRASDRAAAPDDGVEAELKRLRALSTEDLLVEMFTLNQVGSTGKKIDGKAIVRVCDVLLARDDLPASKRYWVLITKGGGHKAQTSPKDQGQRPLAESAFREAMNLAGSGTAEARDAEKQLAWAAQWVGDHRPAAEIFLRLSADTRDTAASRAANRLSAAEAFDLAKDAPRATTELQSLIDEFGSSAEARPSVDAARKKLDEISTR